MINIICYLATLLIAVIASPIASGPQFTVTSGPRDVRHNSSVLESVCGDLTPVHGRFKPLTTPSPYVIAVAKNSTWSGDTIQLILYGTNSTEFRGVYIQGREGNAPVGKFRPSGPNTPDITLTDCAPGTQNTASFISYDPINQLILSYVVPNVRSLVFKASFVRTYSEFWTNVESETITVT